MTETTLQLEIEYRRLMAKWEVKGLWIWEKFRLDRIRDELEIRRLVK